MPFGCLANKISYCAKDAFVPTVLRYTFWVGGGCILRLTELGTRVIRTISDIARIINPASTWKPESGREPYFDKERFRRDKQEGCSMTLTFCGKGCETLYHGVSQGGHFHLERP